MQATNPLDGLTIQQQSEEEIWDAVASQDTNVSVSKRTEDLRVLAGMTWNRFAQDLNYSHARYGRLSDKQWYWVHKIADEYRAEKAQPVASAPVADVDVDGGGYFGHDGKRYKIDAPSTGKWAGWIFFKTGSDYHDQVKLGSARPGGSYQGKASEVFTAIVADLQTAREEYARITGNCYACNRKLEDPTSVALGIGPICRNK